MGEGRRITGCATAASYPAGRGAGEDLQRLMNALMNVAEPRLKQAGGFAPFAASLDMDGAANVFTEYAGNTELPAREIVARLTETLQQSISGKAVRAVAIAADVQFGRREAGDWRNAAELHIEHESGYCVDIFVPYRVRKGWRKNAGWRVRFSHPVGQESIPKIWSEGESDEMRTCH